MAAVKLNNKNLYLFETVIRENSIRKIKVKMLVLKQTAITLHYIKLLPHGQAIQINKF